MICDGLAWPRMIRSRRSRLYLLTGHGPEPMLMPFSKGGPVAERHLAFGGVRGIPIEWALACVGRAGWPTVSAGKVAVDSDQLVCQASANGCQASRVRLDAMCAGRRDQGLLIREPG
jgi:hypothetical protein